MDTRTSARIAFVGAGTHATQSLYPNLAHIPEFDLVAVCDLVADRARSAARRFGAPESFTDLVTMLDRVRPDGVCVCGPAEMHHAVALEVLRRGVPVFIEKPPAPSPAQAEELVRAAQVAKTWGMVAFMKRFAPANTVAYEYMQSPAFGKLSTITLIHGAGPYDDPRRMLYYNAIHMLDLGCYFAGPVSQVFAFSGPAEARCKAISACLRFAGGTVGHLNMNSGHTWSDCFELTYISGTGAGILIDASRSTEVMAPGARFAKGSGQELFGWSQRYYVSGNMAGWAAGGHSTRGYWGELSHFAKALLGQVAPTPTLADGLAAVRLIEAILQSAASGQVVSLE